MKSLNNTSDPALIYVHIPKSAGSSFRQLVWDNYGKENVFWYGIDVPAKQSIVTENLTGYKAIGGHFNLPDLGDRFSSSLRTAVVRDPLERAVSLFHYYSEICPINERDTWLRWGLNPANMHQSLNRCLPFRRVVSNRQCRILSGNCSFNAVREAVAGPNTVLGSYDNLEQFVEVVSSLLSWPYTDLKQLNVGKSGYYEDIVSNKFLLDELTSLNSEDIELYKWLRKEGIRAHIEKPRQFRTMFANRIDKNVARYTTEMLSNVRILINDEFKAVTMNGERLTVPVELLNNSRQTLHATDSHPITFGAHWLYSDCTRLIHEGGRCQLPRSVGPGETLEANVTVEVPKSIPAGNYMLSICLVHKGVRWLDTIEDSHVGKLPVTVNGPARG